MYVGKAFDISYLVSLSMVLKLSRRLRHDGTGQYSLRGRTGTVGVPITFDRTFILPYNIFNKTAGM